MNRQEFINRNLDDLIANDADVAKQFQGKTESEKAKFMAYLQEELGKSYDHYAKEYFETKGIGSYVSNFLRIGGAASNAIGTYMFWALGGAGFAFKGAGLVANSLADLVDNAHYEAHKKDAGLVSKDGLALATESVLSKAAGYLPIGVGDLVDLLRGSGKYDKTVTNKAAYAGRNAFLDRFRPVEEKKPDYGKIIPLPTFDNPVYANDSLDTPLKMAA